MKVLVSGSTGLVGSDLVRELKAHGHHVTRLVRKKRGSADPEIVWNPSEGTLNAAELEGFDAVINLAGENIAEGRWSDEKKQDILDSRIKTTALLAKTIAGLTNKPQVFLSASAIGFYGDRGNDVMTEVSKPGRGFLPRVCTQWEAATQPAKDAGVRVVNYRIGVVLTPKGAALQKMILPFQLGLAGNLSLCGKQYFSWITLQDVVGGILHCLDNATIAGPVNATAPNPVTNAQFTDAMRKRLIPSFLPMHYWTPPAPGLAVKALLGDMGDELLLSSTRVLPVRLEETGYNFKHREIKKALADII